VRRGVAAVLAVCVFLEVLGLLVALDRYLAHGLLARWTTPTVQERPVLTETVEHRVVIRNELRPLARMVQAWPEGRPIPDGLPPIDVDFDAWLEVPEGPPLALRVVASGTAELRVDGRPAQEPIEPGRHRLQVRWRSATQAPGRDVWDRSPPVFFRLEWGLPGAATGPVPASALTPRVPDPSRPWAWALGLLLALGLAAGTYVTARASGEARARRGFLLAAAVLVLLGGGLRLYDYTVAPDFRENMDELFAAWNGWQLVEDGTTRGWSLWPHRYGAGTARESVTYWRERPIPVIRPYFEHPPLFHLLVGVAAHLGGAQSFEHVRVTHTRLVPIALSMIALLLCMALALRVARSRMAALAAGLFYAVTPFVALQGRAVKEDSLVAVLLPAMILAFLRWRDRGYRRVHLAAAAVFAGLGILAKLPAIALLVALVALVVATGRPRDATFAAVLGAAVASLLLVYAAVMGWDAFWHAQRVQGSIRQVSPDVFQTWFAWPMINTNKVGRGPLIFLWVASAVTAYRLPRPRALPVVLPLAVYIVAAGLPSGTWQYGWYMLPVYPLLCALAGAFAVRLVRRPELFGGLLVVGLLTLYAVMLSLEPSWVADPGNWRRMRGLTWGLTLGVLAPVGLATVFTGRWARRLGRAATVAALLLYATASSYFVLRYDVTERLYYDYDYGFPGLPVPGGRRDPYSAAFGGPLPSAQPTGPRAGLPVAPRAMAPASMTPRRVAPASMTPRRMAPASMTPRRVAPASMTPRRMAPGTEPGPL